MPAFDPANFPFTPKRVDLGDGETLSVTDTGAGPVVVLAHGTPTWSYEWRHLLRALSARYRCIAPDHLGFGLSPRPLGADYSPEAHARRFSKLLEVLGVERYHLVVHDFGGPIALDGALAHPERVSSVTLFNTFAWPFSDDPTSRRRASLAGTSLFRWAYGALNLSFVISRSAWGDPKTATKDTWPPYLSVFPDAASRRLVLWALAKSLLGSTAFFESLWARRQRLAATPMHVVWGLKDSAFPPSALAKLREAWPHASVHELATAGHWPHEEQPAVCAESVLQFLDRVTSERAAATSP